MAEKKKLLKLEDTGIEHKTETPYICKSCKANLRAMANKTTGQAFIGCVNAWSDDDCKDQARPMEKEDIQRILQFQAGWEAESVDTPVEVTEGTITSSQPPLIPEMPVTQEKHLFIHFNPQLEQALIQLANVVMKHLTKE